MEHISAMRRKQTDSVIYKHQVLEHPNEEVDYRMEMTGVFKDALTRQANEAVRISSRQKSELLNRKSELNHPPIARIVVAKKYDDGFMKRKPTLSPGL